VPWQPGLISFTKSLTVQQGSCTDAFVQKSPDRHPGGPITTSGSNSSKTSRRHKVYCDKWIHEGVCAFTQQGCKFKHEMPFDEETQRSLGLFQGLPGWYLKSQDETRSSITLSGEQVGRVTGHTRAGERRDVVASHPLSGFDSELAFARSYQGT